MSAALDPSEDPSWPACDVGPCCDCLECENRRDAERSLDITDHTNATSAPDGASSEAGSGAPAGAAIAEGISAGPSSLEGDAGASPAVGAATNDGGQPPSPPAPPRGDVAEYLRARARLERVAETGSGWTLREVALCHPTPGRGGWLCASLETRAGAAGLPERMALALELLTAADFSMQAWSSGDVLISAFGPLDAPRLRGGS